MTVPAVSVVVSTRNRAQRLGGLIGSLRDQTLDPQRFEVVVVNDGSSDDTPEVLRREQREGGLSLRTIEIAQDRSGGPARGRNAGWRAAKGRLIAFTDDDCEATPGWLRALVAASEERPGAILQGPTEPIPRERDSQGPFTRTQTITGLGPHFQTCNIAYPRVLLAAVDGFDERTFPRYPGAEDADLAWRAQATGAATAFVDAARVYHAVNQLGPLGKLRLAAAWSDIVALFARHPPMRRHLHHGIFWKAGHELLLRALLGAVLTRRLPPAILLALPYARRLRRRARAERASLMLVPYFVVHDALEVYAMVRGSIRHRYPVL